MEKCEILQVGRVYRNPEDGQALVTGWVFQRSEYIQPFSIPIDIERFFCGGYTIEELETIANER